MDTPTTGKYILNNKDVSQLNDDELAKIRNKEIGFVFQTFNLLPKLNAWENVALPLIYAGITKNKRYRQNKPQTKRTIRRTKTTCCNSKSARK